MNIFIPINQPRLIFFSEDSPTILWKRRNIFNSFLICIKIIPQCLLKEPTMNLSIGLLSIASLAHNHKINNIHNLALLSGPHFSLHLPKINQARKSDRSPNLCPIPQPFLSEQHSTLKNNERERLYPWEKGEYIETTSKLPRINQNNRLRECNSQPSSKVTLTSPF